METYQETVNVFSYNGQLQSALISVSDCQNACSAISTCAGFDFTNSNECWIHTDSTISSQGSGMGVSQYKKNACSPGVTTSATCVETYTETANVFSFGGQRESALKTLSDCQNACNDTSTCAGYDFTSLNECWIHTDSTIRSQSSGSGVSQYRKISCITGATDTSTTTGEMTSAFVKD